MKNYLSVSLVAALFLLTGCSPEVGSTAWCEDMDETPKGEWTANDAKEYAKNCLFRSED
ncbi:MULTISPECIES: DUF3012 domain-containing protein [Marinobacter]|uniref:DUF3012 domain-containing protein n=1 Tax=Marinobacter suaedae TaxID=3057675 RepID=A0ABT8VZE3_9GAMM|nr:MULTISPECIES: DUF3012 domain-containing protein [unclassified Marinobacter]MBZ2169508.1 DUF3012 domain-containing protein [Marinobacter sp. F4216]MDO3721342.1 DUF3012 domain-containing protein [Marinobacter sp. chi1]